ncbi:MAG TPA: sugar nucleotide-binding protein [Chitinivibrionales bacterium]|nr:sugar nucleotide-binding protein [Chitinivibrionales bacterium]
MNSRSRILITGVTSIHGWPIYKKLKAILPPGRLFGIRPPQMTVPDDDSVTSVCMTDADALSAINDSFRPTHVLHAAGVCDLDICEERPKYAHDINVNGAKNIVDVFSADCYIMYFSADLVFSGHNPLASGYTEQDDPDPVSVVGQTYVLAEQEIRRAPRRCIVRLGLPMGESIQGEKGAVDFIEGRLKRGLPMSLFHDEWRSCINCAELADVVLELLDKEAQGLFHLGGPNPISLYDIGKRILEKGNYKKEALRKLSRYDDVEGPPRIGNVQLDSSKVEAVIGRKIRKWAF